MAIPESEQDDFERTHRKKQRTLAAVVAVAVLVPAGWLALDVWQAKAAKDAARLTDAQKAELTALLDARVAAEAQSVAAWNAAANAPGLAAFVPTDAGCAVTLSPPAQLSAAAYVKYGTHDVAFGKWTMCILRDAGVCDAVAQPNPDADRLRARLAADDAYTWDLDQAKAAHEPLPPRMVIVPSAEQPPDVQSAMVGKVNFTPGTFTGRSFLFDQHGIVCAGDVSVRNSKTVDIEYPHFDETPEEQRKMAEAETRAALERDLQMHLRFAAVKALRACVP